MSSNSPKLIQFVRLSLLCTLLISFNLVFAQDYPNTPVGVSQKYFDSIAENDTNKYLDSIIPEDRQRPGVPFVRQLVQGLLSYYGLGRMDAARINVGFVNLVFQEVANDGSIARVQVTGSMRDLNLGIESPLLTELTTVNVDGTWLVRLYDQGNQMPTVNTAEMFPRDAVPPQTPEQIAAATAFEQYMAQSGTQYRAALYQTTQSTATSAIVEIKFELLLPNPGVWVGYSTKLSMRLLGGQWRADTSNVLVSITDEGLNLLNAATQQATDAEAQSYTQMLGGTLIYVLNDGVTIQGRRRDGSVFEVKPENFNIVDLVELMPNGEGFYLAGYAPGKPNLDKYSFQEGQSQPIGSDTITGLSISPDNTKLVLNINDVALQAISTEDGKVIANSPQVAIGYYNKAGLAWSPDSTTVYLRTTSEIKAWHPLSSNTINQLAEITLPYASSYYPFVSNLAISPDGLDLFLGGFAFGIFSIKDKSQFDLSGGQLAVACNPVYSADGSQIIALRAGSWLSKFDLASGNWTPVMQLPTQDTTDRKCPVFDWVPG